MTKKYLLSIYFILIIFLTACGVGNQPKGRQPSADWSRGLPVGSDLRGAVNMLVEAEGHPVHLIWPEAVGEAVTLHYEQLDGQANSVLETELEIPDGRVHSPKLLANGDGTLALFWLARPVGADGWRLWLASLGADGTLAGEPRPLTPAEMNVGAYTVTQTGTVQYLVWEETRADVLYGLQLAAGEPGGAPVELAAGENPSVAADADGQLHLIWLDGGALYYTAYRPGALTASAGTKVSALNIGFGDTLEGPVLALGGEWLYAVWSTFRQSGLEAGTGITEYIAFQTADPQQVEPQIVRVMPEEDQPYEPYTGTELSLTQLVPPPPSPLMNTDYVGDPALAAGPGSSVAAVVSAHQEWRQQTVVQLALVIFDGGAPQGYQMAAKTQNVSRGATIATDDMGELYLAWGEGAGGLDAYFASTAPAMRDTINALDAGDAANMVLTSGMESVVGLLFMPLAVLWMLPGAVVTVLWRLRRQEEDSGDLGSRIVFVVAIALYQIVKIMFMPAIQSYVPFSAWLDVPVALREPLVLLVPVLILLVGVLVAEIIRRRREETTTPIYFFIAAGVDAVLTLAIYGVNFLGVF